MSSRKPPLTLVNPGIFGAQPPRPLGGDGRAVWDQVQAEYGIQDVGGVQMLQQICEATDRLGALSEQIRADGEVMRTARGPRAHPALRDEIALRAFICRTLVKLGIAVEPLKAVGRPGSGGLGWVPPR
jgi:hypothetical protein